MERVKEVEELVLRWDSNGERQGAGEGIVDVERGLALEARDRCGFRRASRRRVVAVAELGRREATVSD